MNAYHLALLVATIPVLWLSAKTPRAWLWIGGLAGSFVVSVAYLRYYESIELANLSAITMPGAFREFPYVNLSTDWLPPSIIAGATDVLLCACIRVFGQERWETVWFFRLMLASVAVNLVYSSGLILGFPPVPDQDTLGIILEIINYLALLLIGGTGLLDRVGASHGNVRTFGSVRSFLHSLSSVLHKPSGKHPFWGH